MGMLARIGARALMALIGARLPVGTWALMRAGQVRVLSMRKTRSVSFVTDLLAQLTVDPAQLTPHAETCMMTTTIMMMIIIMVLVTAIMAVAGGIRGGVVVGSLVRPLLSC